MKIEELQGKRILILGYAREGQATERFLKKFVPSAHVEIGDQTTDPNYLDRQKDFDIAIKTPAIPKRWMQIPYTTGTNIFFANCKNKIIGVTGSKGKSTTASLISAMLKRGGVKVQLLGNIGKPVLDALSDGLEEDVWVVMEMSSYQLDDITYAPHIAVFTSIFPEHLDYHGGFEEYFAAKARITKKQKGDDYFVYNPSYLPLTVLAQSVASRAMPFVESLPFSTDRIKLEGSHNVDNIRGAYTVARLLGVSDRDIESAVRSFDPLPHRLQNIGTYRDIVFYDDAIATAPEATIQALESLPNVETVFLGGTDRGYHFEEFARVLSESQVKNIVFFPDTGARIEEALKAYPTFHPTILHTESMQEAVKFAYEKTTPGTICLLSTASPSYRLWKNFEVKGDEFQKFVRELA